MITEDDVNDKMMKLRGGCRCSDPNSSPPCWPCSSELSAQEAEDILNEFLDEGRSRTDLLRLQQWFIENGYEPRFKP